MAESKFPSEGDSLFKHPIQVESEHRSSEQLLQIQLNEQRRQDIPESLQGNYHRDIQLDGIRLSVSIKSGKLYRGKGQGGNKGQRSPGHIPLEQKGPPTNVSGGCFQKLKEGDAVASSQIIRLLPGTTTKTYPQESGIVATHYGVCFGKTQKPSVVGDGNTVIVYEPLQQESQLHPTVLSFTSENGRDNEFDVD